MRLSYSIFHFSLATLAHAWVMGGISPARAAEGQSEAQILSPERVSLAWLNMSMRGASQGVRFFEDSGHITTGSLFETRFEFGFLAWKDEAGERLRFRASLPVRQGKAQGLPSGSRAEIGGFDLGLKAQISDGLSASLTYQDLRSESLGLNAAHSNLSLETQFERRLGSDRASLTASGGPELRIPLSAFQPNSAARYGLGLGGRALLRSEVAHREDLHFRFSVEALLRRQVAYAFKGESLGGGGLFTLSPQLDYLLVDGLWIGMRWDQPLLRPVGREVAMGDPSLPGLYGKALSLHLTAYIP